MCDPDFQSSICQVMLVLPVKISNPLMNNQDAVEACSCSRVRGPGQKFHLRPQHPEVGCAVHRAGHEAGGPERVPPVSCGTLDSCGFRSLPEK